MKDLDLLRYSRQIMLPQIDINGQNALLDCTMLLVGLGGLGCASAMYLASAGVGHLIIADFDKVELTNLQRQIIYNTDDIGKSKVICAKDKILAINPNIKVTTAKRLDKNNLDYWVSKADIVLDGSDNFATRFLVNSVCVDKKKPLISAAVIRFEGQLAVFKGYMSTKPCYQCLYPINTNDDANCVQNGVLSPLVGVVGSLQAVEAIKTILNLGEQLLTKLLLIDALNLSFRSVVVNKDPHCIICS